MVFFKGQKTPKSLSWKEIETILKYLGAEYHSTEGSHNKYKRKLPGHTYIIIVPKYSDIGGTLLRSIIHQIGVSKKEFWKAYFEGFIKSSKLEVAVTKQNE